MKRITVTEEEILAYIKEQEILDCPENRKYIIEEIKLLKQQEENKKEFIKFVEENYLETWPVFLRDLCGLYIRNLLEHNERKTNKTEKMAELEEAEGIYSLIDSSNEQEFVPKVDLKFQKQFFELIGNNLKEW